MIDYTVQTEKASSKSDHRAITVIAHRGLCSVFPQNTIEAIVAGLFTSDLSQLDVHLTKDNEVVVTHDRYLSRTTNVCEFPEFADRFKTEAIDSYREVKTDWWIRDFTLAQLRRLRVYQPVSYRPQLPMRFHISTLEEVLIQALKITNDSIHKHKLKSGILIEIKQQIADIRSPRDKILCDKILELLKKYNLDTLKGCQKNNLNIVLQTFCIPLFDDLESCQNWQVQLYESDFLLTQQILLKNRKKNIKGVAISKNNLVDQNGNPQKKFGQLCAKLNYSLYYWTIRDDDINSLLFGCQGYSEVYIKLKQLGVTGFITEFPDKCKGVLNLPTLMYKKNETGTEGHNCDLKNRKSSESKSEDSSSSDQEEKRIKKQKKQF